MGKYVCHEQPKIFQHAERQTNKIANLTRQPTELEALQKISSLCSKVRKISFSLSSNSP